MKRSSFLCGVLVAACGGRMTDPSAASSAVNGPEPEVPTPDADAPALRDPAVVGVWRIGTVHDDNAQEEATFRFDAAGNLACLVGSPFSTLRRAVPRTSCTVGTSWRNVDPTHLALSTTCEDEKPRDMILDVADRTVDVGSPVGVYRSEWYAKLVMVGDESAEQPLGDGPWEALLFRFEFAD
jgi:hypothetical protein